MINYAKKSGFEADFNYFIHLFLPTYSRYPNIWYHLEVCESSNEPIVDVLVESISQLGIK